MSMIRKIIPVSLYDIPGLEGWLEEQASQGLFPTSLGSWAVFEDRGLPGTRFRLDPFANRTGAHRGKAGAVPAGRVGVCLPGGPGLFPVLHHGPTGP